MADNKDTKKADDKPTPSLAAINSSPKESVNKLSAPEGFKLVNWPGGTRIAAGKHGIVDLEDLSPVRAGRLVDSGFKFLARK